jgi:hypothetical protein
VGRPGPVAVRDIIAYIVAHEVAAMLIAFAGLLLIGIVSMTFVLLDHKRNPPPPFEFVIRNELLDAAWRQVGDAWARRRFDAFLWRTLRAFWLEYRNLKAMSEMGRLDWALISGGIKVAVAVVSIDTVTLIVRVADWVAKR